ncbi:MAG: hypothetical protein RLZ98_826 [Pseudomonadota bacterium]|jgi:3-oxoadipate enol-lactonase
MAKEALTHETKDHAIIGFDLYGDRNAKKRIVLVHSLAMDREFWAPVAERLAGDAAVIAVDCRGHGKSKKPQGPYTVELFANDIRQVALSVGWDKTVIAGASMGGTVTLAYATKFPQNTAGVGLIDTTAYYGDDAETAWRGRAEQALAKGLSSMVEFQTTRWFGDAFREKNPDVVKGCVDKFLKNDLGSYAETCYMLGTADLRDKLGTIKVPTRIVVGEEDYATPVAMAEAMKAAIPQASFRVLEKARHLTPLECPDIIADELKQLLADSFK